MMNTFFKTGVVRAISVFSCMFFLVIGMNVLAQSYNNVPAVAGVGLRANMSPISSGLGGGSLLCNYNNTYSDLSNPAGVGFSSQTFGANLVYNPWVVGVSGGDMFNVSLGAYYKVAATHGAFIKASFFNIGDVNLLTGDPTQGGIAGVASLFDWTLAGGYSYAITKDISIAADVRFYQSKQLSSFISSVPPLYSAANVVSGDLYVWYHQRPDSGKVITFDAALSLSNLGTKATFEGIKNPYFIPAYASIAGGVSALFRSNTLRFMLEVKKDLVPYAPPTTASQTERQAFYDMSVFDTWKQALKDDTYAFNLGLEYVYSDFIFVRVGYMNENFSYSMRDGYTFGLGYISPLGLSAHISYLLPGNAYQSSSRFTNNFAVGITYDF